MSFIERCSLFGVSFIGGSTVLEPSYLRFLKAICQWCFKKENKSSRMCYKDLVLENKGFSHEGIITNQLSVSLGVSSAGGGEGVGQSGVRGKDPSPKDRLLHDHQRHHQVHL